jgi:HAE1 family hydrophobic/amphiphilic exporter-1
VKSLYSSPLRVYLCLGILALAGVISGIKLPVSLFPNSSKPVVSVSVSYGNSTADEFLRTYGSGLEAQLRAINTSEVQVEKLKASYGTDQVSYSAEFKWGSPQRGALREVEAVANAYAGRFSSEVRDSLRVDSREENSGFLAVSFYSDARSLDEVYNIIEPVLMPLVSKVSDAENPGIWNPSDKEVRVELDAERMASLQLLPRDISEALSRSLSGFSGGSVTVGLQQFSIQMPRLAQQLDDISSIPVTTPGGQTVHLGDVAKVDFGPRTSGSNIMKTSGAPSLILWASPRPGGNIKRMSEEIMDAVRAAAPDFPKDIQYKVLVDPSEFINNAIQNVLHEVAIGAFLAVCVLFLFIGSLRNVVTAAIEIPLSMVLAFILMRFSGMNLNLISLGGLALSAGMNVDASVVVMENIFRHFEELPKGTRLSYADKLKVLTRAVSEVRFAVIASTIASLVVFLPLAFTSDLTYAILGDLAKTVVFSHGLSAFVALILVPTVRLQLMSLGMAGKGGATVEKPVHSPIEPQIRKLEEAYGRALGKFISSPKIKWLTYGGSAAVLAALVAFALPRLPKEILGKPDTDRMMVGMNVRGNTMIKQMEAQAAELEARFLAKFGSSIDYTFSQVHGPNGAWIMARLKDKSEMRDLWKKLEAEFVDTPFVKFWVSPWNPAELPIPDPPQMRLVVRGGSIEDRAETARQLKNALDEKKVLPRIWSNPEVERLQAIVLRPNIEQWSALRKNGSSLSPGDLADLTRVATEGRRIGQLSVDSRATDVYLRYPDGLASSVEDLASLPIGVGSKLVPLKALTRIAIEDSPPTIFREDERELVAITGRKNETDDRSVADKGLKLAEQVVADWKAKQASAASSGRAQPAVYFEDAEVELNDALKQLAIAVALSILAIFVTLLIQFGSFMSALLVLVAVPLGFIGVLTALTVFRSTLSLNSVLGVILLNGLAVANSIILVDFLKRLVDQGMDPVEAAVTAGRKRLRPILITSLTTILGMLPIAIGMGDGGRILQPLGIAVSGGLWVSMGLTLFVVPALQVSYLTLRSRRQTSPSDTTPIWLEPSLPSQRSGGEAVATEFERPGARQTVAFVSGAVVADEVAAEGAASRDPILSEQAHRRDSRPRQGEQLQ